MGVGVGSGAVTENEAAAEGVGANNKTDEDAGEITPNGVEGEGEV